MDAEHLRKVAGIAVGKHITRYGMHGQTREELFAEAYYGIAQALAKIDRSLHANQNSRYLEMRASGALLDAWRTARGLRKKAGGNPELHSLDAMPHDPGVEDDGLTEHEAREAVRQAIFAVLRGRDLELVLTKFLNPGYDIGQIARLFGITANRANVILHRSAARVRDHLLGE